MRARWLPELISQYKITDEKKSPFSKYNPYRLDNVKILVNYLNPQIEVIDVFEHKDCKRLTAMVNLRCTCGNIHTMQLSQLDNPKNRLTCTHCSCKRNGKQSSLKHLHERITAIENAGYKLIDTVDETIRIHDKILLETKEGYRIRMSYGNIMQHYKDKTSKNANIFSIKYNKENVIYNINIFFKNNNIKTRAIKFTKINEKNISAKTYIQCKCECGNYFETALYELVCYGKIKCNKCSKKISKWCIKVEDFLEENNLTFKKEIIFKDCRDKHPLPFDYKLDINNGLIEVDGEQHFYNNGYAIKMDEKEKIENFKIRKKHDNIKEEYCKKNNIKFLRISYKEILNNSYKDKILSFIT